MPLSTSGVLREHLVDAALEVVLDDGRRVAPMLSRRERLAVLAEAARPTFSVKSALSSDCHADARPCASRSSVEPSARTASRQHADTLLAMTCATGLDYHRVRPAQRRVELDTQNPGDVNQWTVDGRAGRRARRGWPSSADGSTELRWRKDAASAWQSLLKADFTEKSASPASARTASRSSSRPACGRDTRPSSSTTSRAASTRCSRRTPRSTAA